MKTGIRGIARKGIVVYFDLLPLVEHLKPDIQGKLFISALRYAKDGEVPDFDFDEGTSGIWEFIRLQIDRDGEAYRDKVLQTRHARYCRSAKEKGESPLDFDDWLVWREALEHGQP